MADMTMEEIKARFMGVKWPPKHRQKRETTNGRKVTKHTEDCKPENIPEKINWLEKGRVTAVKNQGELTGCGSCWAFSAVGAIEAAYKRAEPEQDLISLSASDLVDCTEDNGCDGGLPVLAFEHVLDNGIATEDNVPYIPREKDCKASIPRSINISSYDLLETGTEEELKRIAGCKGPVSVLVCVDNNFLYYGTGIYDSREDADCTPNHAVLVVGYEPDYWIVKNSWGVGWGEQVRNMIQGMIK